MAIKFWHKIVFLISSLAIASSAQANINDAAVQAALKSFYSSTNGASWTNNAGWDQAVLLCGENNHNPVTGGAYGVHCTDGVVFRLDLANNNLSGSIPAQLADITSLNYLLLNNNQLTGSIPAGLGNIPDLWQLHLQDNQLSGPIPANLGNLANVYQLFLQGNSFGNSLPSILTNLGSTSTIPLTINLDWNAVFSSDATLNTYIDQHSANPYQVSQTRAPTGFARLYKTTTSLMLQWDSFNTSPSTDGGYKIYQSTNPAGPFTDVVADIDRYVAPNIMISGLTEGQGYWYKIQSYTIEHNENAQNVVFSSDDSVIVSKGVPQVVAGFDLFVDENAAVNLQANGTDADGTIASYNWTQLSGAPVVSPVGENSADFSFTAPLVGASGDTLLFEVRVTDDEGDVAYDQVQVVVQNVQALPTVNAGVDQVADENSLVSLTATAADSNGQITGYQWQQVSGMDVLLNGDTTDSVSFTAPFVDADEVLVFRVTVTDDDGDVASDEVQVTITNVNEAPTVDTSVDQPSDEVVEGDLISLIADAVDSDGEIRGYGWKQLGGISVTLENIDQPTARFTAPKVSSAQKLLFEVTVTDDQGETSSATVVVLVTKKKVVVSRRGGAIGLPWLLLLLLPVFRRIRQ